MEWKIREGHGKMDVKRMYKKYDDGTIEVTIGGVVALFSITMFVVYLFIFIGVPIISDIALVLWDIFDR